MNEKLLNTVSELISCLCIGTPAIPAPPPCDNVYTAEKAEDESLSEQEAGLPSDEPLPRFSVLILCGDAKGPSASETASCVFSQGYKNVEVFSYESSLSRFCRMPHDNEHNAKAPETPSGELILILLAGTFLKPHALDLIVEQWLKSGRPDLMYADSEITVCTDIAAPFSKPTATPETVLCADAFSDVIIVTRELFRSIDSSNCCTKDLRLLFYRFLKRAGSAHHIERTLASKEFKAPKTFSRDEIETINKAVNRKGIALFNGAYAGSLQFRCDMGKKLRAAIIVPAKAELKMMQACLDAIDTPITFDRCRLIITADDEAKSGPLHDYLAALKRYKAAKVCYMRGVRSRPELLNFGAEYAYEDRLIFIAPEVVVSSPGFAERLIEPLMLDDIAACGGKQLDRNGMLLHTGFVIGLNGLSDSLYRGAPDDKADAVKCFYTALQRTVSAISGSFMAVRADDFRKAGGFDDTLPNLMWDIAFCIKLKERWLRCMYTPFAEAKSFEIRPAFGSLTIEEQHRCREVLRETLKVGDPYYSSRYDRRSLIPRFAD